MSVNAEKTYPEIKVQDRRKDNNTAMKEQLKLESYILSNIDLYRIFAIFMKKTGQAFTHEFTRAL